MNGLQVTWVSFWHHVAGGGAKKGPQTIGTPAAPQLAVRRRCGLKEWNDLAELRADHGTRKRHDVAAADPTAAVQPVVKSYADGFTFLSPRSKTPTAVTRSGAWF